MNASSPERADSPPPEAPTAGAIGEIIRNVACPGCEYNLRGLRGGVVRCPECGMLCDVARIIRTRWTEPWHKTPGFNTVTAPVWYAIAGVAVVLVGAVVVSIVAELGTRTTLPIVGFVGVAVIMAALWLSRMRRAYRHFEGIRGIMLALLAHVLAVGYLATLTWGVMVVIEGATGALFGSAVTDPVHFLHVLFGAAIFAAGGIVCRRVTGYIAHQCIRRHLEVRTRDDSGSE